MKKILSLVKYGTLAAGTRQRFMQYEHYLREAGYEVEYLPLLNNEHLIRLVQNRRSSPLATALAYARRFKHLLFRRDFDILWVHLELFPYLPGYLEKLGAASGKPVVYDFDDAIFHMYDENSRPIVRKLLGGKLEPLLREAFAACCGNPYLEHYASQFSARTEIFPTVVNTEHYIPRSSDKRDGPIVIGWIGSPSTWQYVVPFLPLLQDLCSTRSVVFRAVGAGARAEANRFDGLQLVQWSEETEISEVQSMDIGIMPLPDEPWARGKSGYKLIQYMACGLPVVASPVGVNAEIVEHERQGFLASTEAEWNSALIKLVEGESLRRSFGLAGRERAVQSYSLSVHGPRLVNLFRDAVAASTSRSS